ncbi:alpha-L-rhamnosidase [Paenibacillus cellulosilyticus]|uniref:alpha-L-rhamnosidase n=1 Tax=Paenibacillus cellulosilyticus TaxID=375489 RepID=A0A2V2YEH7_9BACL|nr:alpha-L-rhamnosidase [Paenibacillus cellulosilyticus]PWV90996.1 alpha-L-rhamnosidase [Paenibacillus cellulosilyticus]QKS45210.1 family 78 glycoside hydrolase catalytic domain [Paenibacillus cellulosilyticus]
MYQLSVYDLTCEYRTNPLGLDVLKPRLSWKLRSDRNNTMQQAYRVQVALDSTFQHLQWDTGEVQSEQSLHVEYEGCSLAQQTRYYYRVRIHDSYGIKSEWSETSWWETGLLGQNDWKGQWITPAAHELDPSLESIFLLRRSFSVHKKIVSARAYASALGLYELSLNGNRVGDELLTPGWTSYSHRIQYQTYDVTGHLQEGTNGIGFMLADGWYKGGMGDNKFRYGDRRAAWLQLWIAYEDGTEDWIVTDSSWRAETGPIVYSNIYHGEKYDARVEREGWSTGTYDDQAWKSIEIVKGPTDKLIAQENEPVRMTEEIQPSAVIHTPNGDTVLDMGQNMVGRIRMTVTAPAGTRIVLKHAEVLDRDGNIYFGNLKEAKQEIEYFAKGDGVEVYAPKFTFQGFRYVRVEGYPMSEDGLPINNFVGEVLHTDMKRTGFFTCSDARVNKLQQNIVWGQRGNFIDVPTDCPQRNERLGWTADAQVFAATALFNYQGGVMFTKYMRDLKAEQQPDGGVPFVIPNVMNGHSAAGWGDAAVIIPWTLYQYYGDTRLLEEQYASMKAWVEYIRAQGDNEYAWNTGFQFGDWLALDAKENSYVGATPRDLVATAYYAYSTRLLRNAAAILGKQEDAEAYGRLLVDITAYFQGEFVTPFGRMASPTQTAHVLALIFDLVEGPIRKRIARDLNELIVENDYHLTTGFVGTPYLCFALSNNGYHETAIRLLQQESYPGWLYAITKGATTIWEHWDSIKPDGSFWDDNMNSFNHYAYGSIGDWLYRKVAGLDMDETAPAYKRIRIRPALGMRGLRFASASFESMYGEIHSGWRMSNGQIEIVVRIPVNTRAEVLLPSASSADIRVNGHELHGFADVTLLEDTENGVFVSIGSGEYRFTYTNEQLFKVNFSENSLIRELLAYEEDKLLLLKHLPEIERPPLKFYVRNLSLKGLMKEQEGITQERANRLLQELNRFIN